MTIEFLNGAPGYGKSHMTLDMLRRGIAENEEIVYVASRDELA